MHHRLGERAREGTDAIRRGDEIVLSLLKTEAVVLRWDRYSETSRVLRIFTRDFGKVAVLAKGADRPRSPFHGSLDLFFHLHVVFYGGSGRGLKVLKECSLIHHYLSIRKESAKIESASRMARLVDLSHEEEDPDRETFGLLLEGLRRVDEGRDLAMHLCLFEVFLLKRLGYLPDLRRCGECGTGLEGREAFYGNGGGLACGRCGGGKGGGKISSGSVAALRFLRSRAQEKAAPLRITARQVEEIRGYAERSFSSHFGRDVESVAAKTSPSCD